MNINTCSLITLITTTTASLNVNKYASTSAVKYELGRFPITHKAWGHLVKYWLRLESGTGHAILDGAYLENKRNNHEWVQVIQYLLSVNGSRDTWLDPSRCDKRQFHRVFQLRLNDQFLQRIGGDITSSIRFRVLSIVKNESEMSPYITKIRNPRVRLLYTRLRIDLHCLATCKTKARLSSDISCPLCKDADELINV